MEPTAKPENTSDAMCDSEKLKIAIEALETLANQDNMTKAAASVTRFGSAGASIAYDSIRKYAQATLDKINGKAEAIKS
jgi:hypothetical protein